MEKLPMTKILALLGLSLALPLAAQADSHVTERRCGWLENPTPANYSLADNDGNWRIAIQGGYQAEGFENLPDVNPSEIERTNGNYGRSCACLDVEVDYAPRIINYIAGGESLPLAACQTGNFDDTYTPAPVPAPVPTKPVPSKPIYREPSKKWEDPSDDSPYLPKDPKKGDSGRDQRDQRDQKDGRDQRDGKDYGKDYGDDKGYEPKLPRTDAEIQIFVDYRGYNDYSYKYVSTFDNVLSADIIYPTETSSNGACFAGNPEAATELFYQMVERMNAETGKNVQINAEVFFDGYDTAKPALRVSGSDEYGRPFVWFDRIRKCDRWSTPEERAHY